MNRKIKQFVKTISFPVTLATALAMTAAPASAETGWQLRIAGAQINPDVSFTDENDSDLFTIGSNPAAGISVSFERRFSSRIGLELGALAGKPEITIDARLGDSTQFEAQDDVRFLAVGAALNFHISPNSPVDLYLGPMVAHVFFGDLGLSSRVSGDVLSQTFLTDDDFAIGGQIGADISFGASSWSLNLAAKYLDTTLSVINEDGGRTDLDFDPVILSVGFGYRF